MSNRGSLPRSFLLTDAAIYSYRVQDHYKDIISFAQAIPPNLRPLFIIDMEGLPPAHHLGDRFVSVASRLAFDHLAEGVIPTGMTPEQDWFGTQTFVNYDEENYSANSDEGSIFDLDDARNRTHHQDYNYDFNLQSPTDSTYYSEGDMSEIFPYPYRMDAYPIRHSSDANSVFIVSALRMADEYTGHYDDYRKLEDVAESDAKKIPSRPKDVVKRYPHYDTMDVRARDCSIRSLDAGGDHKFVTSGRYGFIVGKFQVTCPWANRSLYEGGKRRRKIYKWTPFSPDKESNTTQHSANGHPITVMERINRGNRSDLMFGIKCDCPFYRNRGPSEYFMTGTSPRGNYGSHVCKHILTFLRNTTNDQWFILNPGDFSKSDSDLKALPSSKAEAIRWFRESEEAEYDITKPVEEDEDD